MANKELPEVVDSNFVNALQQALSGLIRIPLRLTELAGALKLFEGSAMFSLVPVAMQLLYAPLKDDVRDGVRSVIDGFLRKGGLAVGGVLLLLTQGFASYTVSVVVLAVACVVAGLAPADDVAQLGIGLFLLGLGWSCTLIAGSTLLVEDVDPADRPAVQGASDLVMNVAGAAGGALAGVVVAVWSYGVLCAVALLPVAALGVLLALPACRARSNTRSG